MRTIDITAKQFEITPAIRERIESRFDKLQRFDIDIINNHVVIGKEKNLTHIEVTCSIPNNQLFAKAEAEDLYAAINKVGQKLERQLTRHLHKDEAHRSARSGKEQCREGTIGAITDAA